MPYRIAGIDVHKRMLAVVVSEVEVDGEYAFERRQFGSNPAQLRLLAAWRLEQQVEEAVMESTAQYGKPVWGALERYWKPLCQKREGARPTAGVNHSRRSPKGNRPMRRILNQAANAAVKLQGSIFALLYRPYVTRWGHNQTIAVIAHRLCRLIWKIPHQGVRYEQRGPAVSQRSKQKRTARMI